MLYVSTRNNTDSYTAHRALHDMVAPGGGRYVPFKLPLFTAEDIRSMRRLSFGDIVAKILNIFFSARLTGWDVEFCCGKKPIQNIALPHRLLVTEAWHNTAADYRYMELALYRRLCNDQTLATVTDWAKIAIRIALLFATFCTDADFCCDKTLDIAVDGEDFIAPMAAWYARKMGLPVGMIICGNRDSGTVWDLLHRGEINCGACEDHACLERLVYSVFGVEEAQRFVLAGQSHRSYLLDEERLGQLNQGLFAAVISGNRIPAVIMNFYRSQNYILDETAAISFGALQDYRARMGESNLTAILSLSNPAAKAEQLSDMLGISFGDIDKTVNRERG